MAKESTFQFKEFFVTKSILFQSIHKSDNDFEVNIKPSGVINSDSKEFQLTLEFELNNKSGDIVVNIEALGLFKFTGEYEDIKQFFNLNAPALMFPYIRAYVSSLSSLSGVNIITLPTYNLSSMQDELENSIEFVSEQDNPIQE